MAEQITGAAAIVRALTDLGVDIIFGYPGGAVLPIYDALHQQNRIHHILVRHEQAAVHAAEGYARSTGKPGVVLVTSGPGATNAGDRDHRCADGLGARGGADRPGPHPSDRHGCVPGMRHGGHHAPLFQA